MFTTETYRTIKVARKELREWGIFWAKAEGLSTGSVAWMVEPSKKDKSNAKFYGRRKIEQGDDRFCAARGVEIPVGARCTETRITAFNIEKEIFVPWHLQGLSDFVDSLDDKLRLPLRKKYIEKEKLLETYWLDRAELAVMNRK